MAPVRPMLFTVLVGGAVACSAPEAAPQPALELTGRVVDAADILSASTESDLVDKLERLENDTRAQLVVATTPDLKGYGIDDYALKLGNAWGVGDSERHDGLLLVVAPNERKVRIEVGLGLETVVTDEEAADILENDILPHFRQGDYAEGIARGVDGLSEELSAEPMRKAA